MPMMPKSRIILVIRQVKEQFGSNSGEPRSFSFNGNASLFKRLLLHKALGSFVILSKGKEYLSYWISFQLFSP